jgi:hypothetical protein
VAPWGGVAATLLLALTATAQTTLQFQAGSGGYAGARDVRITMSTEVESVWDPTANYDLTENAVDGDPVNKETVMRFDVSAIPAGQTVQSATLSVNCTGSTAQRFELYPLLASWVEAQVSWQLRSSGAPWAIGGAHGLSTDFSDTLLGFRDSTSAGAASIPLNVAVVQGWVDNPGSNVGFVFRGVAMDDGFDFSNSEVATVGNRPALTLVYGPGPGTSVTFRNGATPTVAYAGCVDATIASGPDLSKNFDGAPLRLSEGSTRERALVAFDLGSVVPGTTIISATLQFWTEMPGASQVNVYPVLVSWTEGEANWSTRDGTTAWAVAGADGVGLDRNPTAVATLDVSSRAITSATLTSAGVQRIQNWIDGVEPNHGFMLSSTTATMLADNSWYLLAQRPALLLGVVSPASPGNPDGGNASDAGPGTPGVGGRSPSSYRVGCDCASAGPSLFGLLLLAGLRGRPRGAHLKPRDR